MTGPLYLPWLRRGLSAGVGDTDPRSGPLASRAEVTGRVTVAAADGGSHTAEQTLHLSGPGDVVGLDPRQVVARAPVPGSRGVETGYFPSIDLASPDLPWQVTPAQPDRDNALRPWLVLVCVEEQNVDYDGSAEPLPVLRLGGAAVAELPDLAESWAWAHVQSMIGADDLDSEVRAAVESASGAVVARLLCPRRLLAGREYRCAVVPAFDAGRDAGLGRPVDPTAPLGPAWLATDTDVELPVYDSWTFTTAEHPGTFETLAKQLAPASDLGVVGYRTTRLVDDGVLTAGAPIPGDPVFDYSGALVTPQTRGTGLPRESREWLRETMRSRLESRRPTVPRRAPTDYDPQTDDPVVGPPCYGSVHAGAPSLPAAPDDVAWMDDVNLRADHRSSAGLGARVVRDHQEELVTRAWDAAGEATAAGDVLNRGRLSAEVGRSHARRVATLPDEALVQVTAGAQQPADATALSSNPLVPVGLVSRAFGRATRPSGVLARRAGRSVQVVTVGEFLRATEPSVSSSAAHVAGYRAGFVPQGCVSTASRLESSVELDTPGRPGLDPFPVEPILPDTPRLPDMPGLTEVPRDPARSPIRAPRRRPSRRERGRGSRSRRVTARRATLSDAAPRRAGRTPVATSLSGGEPDFLLVQPDHRVVTTEGTDISARAGQIREALDPMPAVVALLDVRVVGMTLVPGAELPTRPSVDATFPDPLLPWLLSMGVELLCPGLRDLGENSVTLLAVNEPWVAAFLAGANHEWSREAVYRRLPTDPRATAFASFFPRAEGTDLARGLRDWGSEERLGDAVGGSGSSTVLVVRGEVIERYPGTEFLLVSPRSDGSVLDPGGTLPDSRVTWPSFVALLDGETALVGFDVDPSVVLAEKRLLGLQEPTTGPRFGLDDASAGEYGTKPSVWSDLSWGHVAASADALAGLSHVPVVKASWLTNAPASGGGAVWARNSAHMAAITAQQPYRLLLPAASLIPAQAGGA